MATALRLTFLFIKIIFIIPLQSARYGRKIVQRKEITGQKYKQWRHDVLNQDRQWFSFVFLELKCLWDEMRKSLFTYILILVDHRRENLRNIVIPMNVAFGHTGFFPLTAKCIWHTVYMEPKMFTICVCVSVCRTYMNMYTGRSVIGKFGIYLSYGKS